MKMMISNICPMCGEYVEQEQKHDYTINKVGKRKVKQFFHTECFGMMNTHQDVFNHCKDSDS